MAGKMHCIVVRFQEITIGTNLLWSLKEREASKVP